jgi:hypothetical protein
LTREEVAQLETGRRSPAWATALLLAEALAVVVGALAQQPTTTGAAPGPGHPRKAHVVAQET